jgi:hypothetical protein
LKSFLAQLDTQRWDDHRYYHHCRINQTLHLLSAISFLCAYALVFKDPALAALIGWLVAMTLRQVGHFVFEPKGYDDVNDATHEHKEAIKVGYNLRRKVVLIAAWALSPALLWLDPTLFDGFVDGTGAQAWVRKVGMLWFFLGVGGLALRTVHLFFLRGVRTGLVWLAKILTDPFNDVRQYWQAPLHLLRGERLDPMTRREPA